MTLEELAIKIKYHYEKQGAQQAKRDVEKLDDEVEKVGDSLDGLNKKFDALALAAVASATAGIAAYQRWSSTMVEFSGKAGQTMKQFQAFTKEADKIARRTGFGDRGIRESMQRAFSLGANQDEAERLATLGAILQSRNQANSAEAVEAAMALRNLGGSAEANLQMTHAASQVGGGNVPDYFYAAKGLSELMEPAGGSIQDALGMLTIGSKGKSLNIAESGIKALITAISREPEKKRGEFYRSVTGQDWSNLSRLFREEGAVGLFSHLNEFFDTKDVFQLFGEREATGVASLLMKNVEELAKNIGVISTAQERDSVGTLEQDTVGSFFIQLQKLSISLGQFLRAWGAPFAKIMIPFIAALRGLTNGILALNEATGGLLAWFAAFATSLFVIPRLFRMLGRMIGALGGLSAFSALRDVITGGGRDGSARKGSGLRDAGMLGIGGLLTAIGGWLSQRWTNIKDDAMMNKFFRDKAEREGLGKVVSGGTAEFNEKTGKMEIRDNKVIRLWAIATLPIVRILGKILLGVLALTVPFALYAKAFDGDNEEVNAFSGRNRQRDYFRAGGARGGEPPPGPADITAANRAIMEAESDLLSEVLWKLVRERMGQLRAMLPEWMNPVFEVIGWLWKNSFGLLHDGFVAYGNMLRKFWSDPRAAVEEFWDNIMTTVARTDADQKRMWIDMLGGETPREADELRKIFENSQDGVLQQPFLSISRNNLKALGITGDYKGLDIDKSIDALHLPTPKVLTHPAYKSPRGAPPVVSMEFNMGDINIGGEHADDRFETARAVRDAVREEIKSQADFIIQEMDFASP